MIKHLGVFGLLLVVASLAVFLSNDDVLLGARLEGEVVSEESGNGTEPLRVVDDLKIIVLGDADCILCVPNPELVFSLVRLFPDLKV